MTTLVRYPSGKAATSFTIPESVTNIQSFAVYRCNYLTSITIPGGIANFDGYAIDDYAFALSKSITNITFNGTKAQWNSIKRGDYWNNLVPATEVICSDGTVSLS